MVDTRDSKSRDSNIMRVRVSLPAQIETSRSDRAAPQSGAAGAGGKNPRREATNSDGAGAAKRAVLSRTKGFVPIFWTKEAISWKLSDEDKKAACFVSETNFRGGSTHWFSQRSKSFLLAFKAARERIISSLRFKYISFGTSPSRYADTSFSMRFSLALILVERF